MLFDLRQEQFAVMGNRKNKLLWWNNFVSNY